MSTLRPSKWCCSSIFPTSTMLQFHASLWLIASLLSQSFVDATNNSIDVGMNMKIEEAFPQLVNLTRDPVSGLPLSLGSQDLDHCCLLAVNQSLDVADDGTLLGLRNPSFIVDNLTTFMNRQFSCGASYIGDKLGAPVIKISYRWCRNDCPGWQISKNAQLNQWVGPFVGFLVPAVVFCLAIPRRRKLHISERLFNIPLNEVTSNFRTPFIATSAAVLVTIYTTVWLMIIFALSGPILLSGIYEATIDERILGYLQEQVRNEKLSIMQRARLLYTVLVGNLDMLKVPPKEPKNDTPLSHIDGLLTKLRAVQTSQPTNE